MRTFDIFDTLIARRCIHAHEIFRLVEIRTGLTGFAAARVEAEKRVSHGEYTLVDIYRGLRQTLSLDDASTDTLMQTEVALELENALPIAENLRRLPQEAVLITDMYLPAAVIRELLRRAGVSRDYPILIASHGKSGGAVWNHLADLGLQCAHLGDNEQSDVGNARKAGMRARLSDLSRPTRFEALLLRQGACQAAQALRAARLRVKLGDLPEWLCRLQFNLNVPFLLTSALGLLSEAHSNGADKVLFASRDGRNLQLAFETLRECFGHTAGVQSEYWYTSRCARTRRSAAYHDYCREAFGGRTVLADLCGTGASITVLLRDLALVGDAPLVYVAQKVDNTGYANHMASRYGLGSNESLIDVRHTFTTEGFLNNALLEQLNYVPEGMVRDVHQTPFGPLPVRDAIDFDDQALQLIQGQHAMLGDYFEALRTELDTAAAGELAQALPAVFNWMHESVSELAKDLETLQNTVGVDDLSNEVLTQRDLAAAPARAARDASAPAAAVPVTNAPALVRSREAWAPLVARAADRVSA